MPEFNYTVEFIPVNFTPPAVLKDKTITANGVYNATSDGANGYSSVTVLVPSSEPVIESLDVTPSTEAQIISASQGIDGYSPVMVSAVDSSIDSNITAENIKAGVSILGVNGSVVELDGDTLSVTPTTLPQRFLPSGGHNGYTEVSVAAVDSSIDPNILSNNILQGVTILGVSGSAVELKGDTLSVTPTTSAQTLTPVSPKNGFTEVSVAAVTAAIDSNITAANIKSGVSILGVNGSVVELNGSTATINPSTSEQTVSPTSPSNGFTEVTIPAVTSAIDANITAGNIKDGVTILGVTGDYQGEATCYLEKVIVNGVLQAGSNGNNFINLSGVTSIGGYGLAYAYYNSSFPANTSLDLSSIQSLGGNAMFNCFYGSSGITSVDLSGITILDKTSSLKSAFQGCTTLVSVDFSGLTSITGSTVFDSAFVNCTSLTTVDFSELASITGSSTSAPFSGTFSGCSALRNISFPKLTTIGMRIGESYMPLFLNCNLLESVSFGGLKSTTFASSRNQIQYLFNTTTGSQATNGCTVHFPSNFDPDDPDHTFDASTLSGYPTFGGNSNYIHIAYDLPATE